jgi:hypothetical protein
MLQQLERDAVVIAATVEQWLEPLSDAAFAVRDNGAPGMPAEPPSESSPRYKRKKAKQRSSDDEDEIPEELSEIAHLPLIQDQFQTRHIYSNDLAAIAEVKQTASERCLALQSLCLRHSNDLPFLKEFVDGYATTLRSVDQDHGMYRLHLEASNIEHVLLSARNFALNVDQPLDAELVMALQSLLVAHVGLISFFPSVIHLTEQMNRYRVQSLTIESLQTRSHSVSADLASQLSKVNREINKYDRLEQRLSVSAVGFASLLDTVVSGVLLALFRTCISVARLFLKAAKHLFRGLPEL